MKFANIDVDENQEAAVEYGISAVPTFIFSNDQRFSGADAAQLRSLIEQVAKDE